MKKSAPARGGTPIGIALAEILVALTLAGPARAQESPRQEPRGCDKLGWPLDREATALRASGLADAGASRTVSAEAFRLSLAADAALPTPPERAPRPGTRAGAAAFAAPDAAAVQVTRSGPGWIDLVQEGRYAKPTAFTGVLDCPGVRKSVRYPVTRAPFVLQVSGATDETVGVVVAPAP